MRLSDLQDKDIVNVEDGKKIGKIIDVVIDEQGNMKSLIVQRTKMLNMFSNASEIEVKWNQIKKIGTDVILVNI
jgi:sporulation protein, ylmC/ymxH family